MYFALNSDNDVELLCLHKRSDPTFFVNDAIVTARVFLCDYVTPVGGPITLAYVAASKGNYRGTLPYTTPLVAGRRYAVNYVIDGAGLHLELTPLVPCERSVGAKPTR